MNNKDRNSLKASLLIGLAGTIMITSGLISQPMNYEQGRQYKNPPIIIQQPIEIPNARPYQQGKDYTNQSTIEDYRKIV